MLHKSLFFPFTILALLFSSGLMAYDDDTQINNINLSPENFLDIKSNSLRKSLDLQWYDTVSGWRMTGGSLDADLLFLQTEAKLHQDLSDEAFVRMTIEQEVFYARKPFPLPLIEIGGYPLDIPLGFSALATFAHDKRQMDLGAAVTLGRRPWDYVRFAWLKVDANYNGKNDFDDSYYSDFGETLDFEGAYQFSNRHKLRVSFIKDQPLHLVTPAENGVFKHEKTQYNVTFDYALEKQTFLGLAVKGFDLQKRKQSDSEDREQNTRFTSLELYWLGNLSTEYELTVGTQWDSIKNQLLDYANGNEALQYSMRTWQLYSILHHDYSTHQGWNLGLYAGHVDEKEDYYSDTRDDILVDSLESKLRTSWQYHSKDKSQLLLIHIAFNVDNFSNDPTDGAGMSFQASF